MNRKNLFENKFYIENLEYLSNVEIDWKKLQKSTILIVGATSMIGKSLTDCLIYKKQHDISFSKMRILCAGRSLNRLKSVYFSSDSIEYIEFDLTNKNEIDEKIKNIQKVDYIFNFASPVGSEACQKNPISIFECNVVGTKNLLEVAREKHAVYVFASSFDVYGENISKIEKISENENGNVDTLGNRASYFESKRMAETLCKIYNTQYGTEYIILRLPKIFGPTFNEQSENLIVNHIIVNAIENNLISLKSAAKQKYSFMYTVDLVSAILTILNSQKYNQAYNISNKNYDRRIIDIANYMSKLTNSKISIDENHNAFFEKPFDKCIDSSKIDAFNWHPKYSLEEAILNIVNILL